MPGERVMSRKVLLPCRLAAIAFKGPVRSPLATSNRYSSHISSPPGACLSTSGLRSTATRSVQALPGLTTRLSSKSTMNSSQNDTAEVDKYWFGPYKINATEVFFSTELSYALVNLKPVVPGHVLVCPKRVAPRFVDLSSEEIADLWLTAKTVGQRLEPYFNASSLTFTIQDGPLAGQTVPHVHIHILPRRKGDFEKNDDIYDVIDGKEKELGEHLNLDQERKDRTFEEMAEESANLRKLF